MQVQNIQNIHNTQFKGTLKLTRHNYERVPLLPPHGIIYETKRSFKTIGEKTISAEDDKLLYKLFTKLIFASPRDWFYGKEKTCNGSGIGGSSVDERNYDSLVELENKIKEIFELPQDMKIFIDKIYVDRWGRHNNFDYAVGTDCDIVDNHLESHGNMHYWILSRNYSNEYAGTNYSIEHTLHHDKNSYIPPLTSCE